MRPQTLRRALGVYLALLVPVAWLATRYDPYQMDGDGMAYMDLAGLMRQHRWAGVVNAYWHPLYPALLAVARSVLHATRFDELRAGYALNYAIFLASVGAMLAFIQALGRLRGRMTEGAEDGGGGRALLGLNGLRLLGVALVVIASQRELSTGKIRPDLLLQALLLAAFAALLQALATESLVYAPLMGFWLGLAYLTKSFAFVIALFTVALMVVFQAWVRGRRPARVVAGGVLALAVFAAVAGPYIAALSRQKHRLDFGDSGALNYAWYVSGTEKMHLEPWMEQSFGSARVHLIHPEAQLLARPGIYSYGAEPYGTYPAWFDPTYFHERITPRFSATRLLHRDARNAVLSARYVLNHPEAPILFVLLLVCGGRLASGWRRRTAAFWLPPVLLGVAIWGLYGLVNIEERYVTLAYLLIVLPVFAMLRGPRRTAEEPFPERPSMLQRTAEGMVVLLAFLALGESLRVALEERRSQSAEGLPAAWVSPQIFGAARALNALGVGNGDPIACMGTIACLNDPYWMRLADVRVLTEVYNPDAKHLLEELEGLPNRGQVYGTLKAQGAKVVVGAFDPGAMTGRTPASAGWIRLGESDLYALPLNLAAPPPTAAATQPWDQSGPAKP